MKKVWVTLLLVAFFLGACAAVPKTPLSLSPLNPAGLRGTWEGQRTMQFDKYVFQDVAVLEIQTAAPPFKGKLTIYPAPRWTPGQTIQTYSFDRGEISGEGTLFLPMEQDTSANLRLFQGEKSLLLEGDFNYRTNKGSLSLRKK